MNDTLQLFSCLPECHISQLGIYEWLLIIVSIALIYFIVRFTNALVLNSTDHKYSNNWWHAPKIVYISLLVGFVTASPVILLLGFDIARLYAKTLLPILCIIIYLLWLSYSDEQKT